MTGLQWNRPSDQTYEAGLDRGVLYPESGGAVVWNGLLSVEDSGESEVKELFIDGQKFLSLVSPRDWQGSIEALTFPDEFVELIGIAELGDGLYADSQVPERFDLSYRTMVNTPATDETQHYKIHLIYGATASIGSFSHASLSSDAIDPTPFQFELSAIPQTIPGFRPTAHLIIDTRHVDPTTRGTLEGILYGNARKDPSMPRAADLLDLLNFSGPVIVVDNEDGTPENPLSRTWTATGSNDNIKVDRDGFFVIKNVEAEFIDDDTYKFLLGGDVTERLILVADVDGVPYQTTGTGTSNMGMDDDTPYFGMGLTTLALLVDEDGTLYYEFAEDVPNPDPDDWVDGGAPENPTGTSTLDGGRP